MLTFRLGPYAEIECIVLIPLSNRMRMPAEESIRMVALGRSAAKVTNFVNFQVSEYAMVAAPAIRRSEQAKKEKYVADTDTVSLQMRLGCARLSESPAPIHEHRVFVAESGGANASFSHLLDNLSEPRAKVACLRASLGWNRKTNWFPRNDRRRGFAGRTIEALSTKDYSHNGSFAIVRTPSPRRGRGAAQHAALRIVALHRQ